MVRLKALGLALLAAAVITAASAAFEVRPMRVVLDLGRGETTTSVSVGNAGATDLPIEVSVKRRDVDENGQVTVEDDEESFIVFPPQALVPAGGSQSLRLQYIGDPALEASRSYLVRVTQVPVTPEDFSGVIVAYEFGVAVYVRAPESSADVSVESYEVDGSVVTLQLVNRGNDHAFLEAMELRLDAPSGRVTIPGTELAARIDFPVLAPLSPRRIAIDFSAADDLQATEIPSDMTGLSLTRSRR